MRWIIRRNRTHRFEEERSAAETPCWTYNYCTGGWVKRMQIAADSSQPTADSKRPGLDLTVGDTGLFSGQGNEISETAD